MFKKNQAPAPVYFYCSRNPAGPGRSDPSQIVASIARQLSTLQPKGPLLQAAIEEYREQEESTMASGPLQLNESKDLILKLLKEYKDATVTIVIDAMDECSNQQDFLGILEDLLETSPCLLKIFVSSREDQGIVYRLGTYTNLHLSSYLNWGDIELFV